MVKVGIDGKPLQPPRGGVARYLEGVLAGCASASPLDLEIEVVTPRTGRRTLPWVLANLQRATGRGFSVFHFPFYYVPLAPRCPVTVAIHDVLVLEHPEWFARAWLNPLRVLIPRAARRAEAVVTFSQCVADAIAERCRVPPERIRVTGHGVDTSKFRPPNEDERSEACRRLRLPRSYLLQVGALEPRRGVDLAMAATRMLRTRFPDLELVLVGEMRSPVSALHDVPGWVRRLGWVDDADLPALYAGAAAVLAPSRGEGFDLPVLEALASGAVVVASDIPPHREHFESAVQLFASGNAEALAEAVATALEDSELAARLRAAGPPLAGRFGWNDVARRHIDLWREVAAG
jgi:glycosyltransferase involved in cell wall biosynthesis